MLVIDRVLFGAANDHFVVAYAVRYLAYKVPVNVVDGRCGILACRKFVSRVVRVRLHAPAVCNCPENGSEWIYFGRFRDIRSDHILVIIDRVTFIRQARYNVGMARSVLADDYFVVVHSDRSLLYERPELAVCSYCGVRSGYKSLVRVFRIRFYAAAYRDRLPHRTEAVYFGGFSVITSYRILSVIDRVLFSAAHDYLIKAHSVRHLAYEYPVGVIGSYRGIFPGSKALARVHRVRLFAAARRQSRPDSAEAVYISGFCVVTAHFIFLVIDRAFPGSSYDYLVVTYPVRHLADQCTESIVNGDRGVFACCELFVRVGGIRLYAAAYRNRLPHCAEAVYVHGVRGVPADSVKLHLIGYRVVDLVVVFTHRLLCCERAEHVVLGNCYVGAGFYLRAALIKPDIRAYRYRFPHRAETVYHRRVRRVFADRVFHHLVGYRVVDLVVAFAYCLLIY